MKILFTEVTELYKAAHLKRQNFENLFENLENVSFDITYPAYIYIEWIYDEALNVTSQRPSKKQGTNPRWILTDLDMLKYLKDEWVFLEKKEVVGAFVAVRLMYMHTEKYQSTVSKSREKKKKVSTKLKRSVKGLAFPIKNKVTKSLILKAQALDAILAYKRRVIFKLTYPAFIYAEWKLGVTQKIVESLDEREFLAESRWVFSDLDLIQYLKKKQIYLRSKVQKFRIFICHNNSHSYNETW